MPVAEIDLKNILDKRQNLFAQATTIRDKASEENRDMTNEEFNNFKTIMAEVQTLKTDYDNKFKEREDYKKALEQLDNYESIRHDPTRTTTNNQPNNNPLSPEDRKAVKWASKAVEGMSVGGSKMRVNERRFNRTQKHDYMQDFCNYLRGSGPTQLMNAAFRTADPTRGGYFVSPEEMYAGILQDLDDTTFVQGLSSVFTTSAQSFGVRKRTAKATMINWGSELFDASNNPESGLTFGKKTLTPEYMVGEMQESFDLLANADMDIDAYIQSQLVLNISEFLEQAFISGTGNNQPLGLFTASTDGISTARDSTGGSSNTAFTFDSFIKAKYILKEKYRKNAVWMLHRSNIGILATLKDTNLGQLWRPTMVVGEPDTILGRPVIESEWVPNTNTSGLYWGMLADFRYYWIVYNKALEMRALDQIEARKNKMVWNYRLKVDAMPILEEAFVRLKFT